MISRRLVRIKTLQGLYAFKQAGLTDVAAGKKILEHTLFAPFDVFLYLLEFPFYFNEYLESEKAQEKAKYYPDKAKIHDCNLFSPCALTDVFHSTAIKYRRNYFKENWPTHAEQFQGLFEELRQLDFVRDRLVFEQPNLEQEKVFFEAFYHYLIHGSESFHALMDDQYSNWNDDEEVLLRELVKTILSAKAGGEVVVPAKPTLADEDIQFGMRTLELVVINGDLLEQEIEKVTDNWDPGRIAVLDLICIKMALTEFLNFNMIPVKVTINEYLDISREYSTPGSSRFLNGILDKLRMLLEKEGRIQKSGRGLRDR